MAVALNGERNMARNKIRAFAACLLFCASPTLLSDDCPVGPYVYYADIVEVYDGDTVTADIDLGFHTWRRDEKLRLFGIDAPEVRGDDKQAGFKSRDWLREQVLDKRIIINTVKYKGKTRGKYGRYLARLFVRNENVCLSINDELVRKGLAVYREY